MKIFYKYIFCLLVYVIPFSSTVTPLRFSKESRLISESTTVRTNMIKLAKEKGEIFKDHPMEVEKWNNASFDEVLKEVVPFVCFVGDKEKVTTVNDSYIEYCINVKNKISETIMKIANGEAKGGHIAVARVILDDGGVIPLPCFFLSGDSDSAAYNVLGIKGLDADGKYFTTISSQGMSATTAQAFSHSERAIGIYLHNNLKTLIDQAKVDKEVSKKPIIIQIKNSAPMCDKCKLFWSHKAYYKDNMLCGKDTSGAAIYDVWADFSISSILFCSNVAGQVDIEQEDLIKFVYKNRQNVTNTAPLSQGKKPQGIKRKHSKITPLATS